MGCLTVFRAIVVRLLFALHSLITVWRLHYIKDNQTYWYFLVTLLGLALETGITVGKKGGHEWKWFCPSVFIYLLSVVPALWFLELDDLDKRTTALPNSTEHRRHSPIEDKFIGYNITVNIQLDNQKWNQALEQMLLLILIVGRWLLPKGKLTHDQLSQLLLVYIGTAADIVEFLDSFTGEKVYNERSLCYIILTMWSFSLIQFTLVLTATTARTDQSGVLSRPRRNRLKNCCQPDVYGIVISIFLQDGPFLALRLLLIFKYDVITYSNIFFTSKNSLVIALLLYRLAVVQLQTHKPATTYPQQQQRLIPLAQMKRTFPPPFTLSRPLTPPASTSGSKSRSNAGDDSAPLMTRDTTTGGGSRGPDRPSRGIKGREYYRRLQQQQQEEQLQQQQRSFPSKNGGGGGRCKKPSRNNSAGPNSGHSQPYFPHTTTTPSDKKMSRPTTADRFISPV